MFSYRAGINFTLKPSLPEKKEKKEKKIKPHLDEKKKLYIWDEQD